MQPCKYCGGESRRNQYTFSLFGLNKTISCKSCPFYTRLCKTWQDAADDWKKGCGWMSSSPSDKPIGRE